MSPSPHPPRTRSNSQANTHSSTESSAPRYVLNVAFAPSLNLREPVLRTAVEPYYPASLSHPAQSPFPPSSNRYSHLHPHPHPHPPAPPVPPRPHPPQQQYQYRPAFQTQDSPPSLVPTFTYYRQQTAYDAYRRPEPSRPSTAAGSHGGNGSSATRTQSRGRSRSSSSGNQEEIPVTTPDEINGERLRDWREAQVRERERRRRQRSASASASTMTTDEYGHLDHHDNDDNDDGYGDALEGQGLDSQLDDERGLMVSEYGHKLPNEQYYPGAHHQAQFKELKNRPQILAQRAAHGLNRLQDCDSNDRPAYPLPIIITCAISGSPRERLTLAEIYTAMELRFPYYSHQKSWKNSVRHNLSLNNRFQSMERPITEPGKGGYWVINADLPPGNKRARKRNKPVGKRALAQQAIEAAKKAQEEGGGAGESFEPDISGSGAGPSQSQLSISASGATPMSGHESTPSVSASESTPIPIDPSLVGVGVSGVIAPTGSPPYVSGVSGVRSLVIPHATLPANAGSYAAVTGILGSPAPIDMQYYTPWEGVGEMFATDDSGAMQTQTQTQHMQPQTQTQPRFGPSVQAGPIAALSSSSAAAAAAVPPSTSTAAATLSTRSGGAAKESSSSSKTRNRTKTKTKTKTNSTSNSSSGGGGAGPHRTQPTRAHRSNVLSPLSGRAGTVTAAASEVRAAPVPIPAPASNGMFNALAAQIEREGVGARGSGGPGLGVSKARRAGVRARGAAAAAIEEDEDESESEGERDMEDDSDDYRPAAGKSRRRIS